MASSSGASHALGHKSLSGKAPGLLTFGVKGGFEAGARFQDALKLFTRRVRIGDAQEIAGPYPPRQRIGRGRPKR
ncbi:hypothetical protein BC427_17480 [Ralstonia solanacearum FJAT-91]|uniref:Uncharacterized protein n=2 Tax=Ralstonia solanacearum species complex TaxID=3116862 RepID=A0A0S4W5Q2_RALSL|nr:hypothetical protein BC427_17480 [Ralstonia solanacearum FJAT-91]ESS51886.1 hypothetical protein L665_03877 [Ralstonia solanacearum SD54]OAK90156.1 hypothetical protein AB851_16490 [Ralstonia pseudosolanacearum]QKZ26230.1 O-acetylhomoserine aminocarboxypropyltransferase/cysteine synthase [Ralstonia solanacearum]CAD16912.1 hypothetical protein RSc3415 [Ralstonia pseudosolanacearum GMI1000]